MIRYLNAPYKLQSAFHYHVNETPVSLGSLSVVFMTTIFLNYAFQSNQFILWAREIGHYELLSLSLIGVIGSLRLYPSNAANHGSCDLFCLVNDIYGVGSVIVSIITIIDLFH